MTYYESARGIWISKARALVEIDRHGADRSEFLADCGDRATYRAQSVLDWLGY